MRVSNDEKSFTVRTVAADAILEITEKKAYANLVLDKYGRQHYGKKLKTEDISLLTELVNGTIKMIKHLDWVLNLFLKKDISKLNPEVRSVLRMSTYQLLFLDRIPAYAVVDEAVKIIKQRKGQILAGVVNGILRAISRSNGKWDYPSRQEQPIKYFSVFYSQPEWFVKEVLDLLGVSATEELLSYYNSPAKVFIRTNFLETDRKSLQAELLDEGIETCLHEVPESLEIIKSERSLLSTKAWQKGAFYIQNPASTLAAHILKPLPGETVYDLCAGVGGKTLHLAEFTDNRIKLIANDIYKHKLTLLEKNRKRLGIENLTIFTRDILQLEPEGQIADKILLDVPCSGWGVLQRRADLRWSLTPEEINEIIILQEKMLHKAAGMLKSGGTLLYVTCTFNVMENQTVINRFLKENKNFMLEDFSKQIDFITWETEESNTVKEGFLTLIPGKYDTDGMFYAKLRRMD